MELKASGGFEETHKALFHHIPFFFIGNFFPFGDAMTGMYRSMSLFFLFSIPLDFCPQLSPPADFAEQLSLHVPPFPCE